MGGQKGKERERGRERERWREGGGERASKHRDRDSIGG